MPFRYVTAYHRGRYWFGRGKILIVQAEFEFPLTDFCLALTQQWERLNSLIRYFLEGSLSL